MRSCCLVLFLICSAVNLSAQNDTTYYSVYGTGIIKGHQKVWKSGPNTYHYTYQFNDRGRGDSTVTILQTNTEGLFTAMETSGVDYYKNKYAESFSIMGDSAIWVVNGDRKSKKLNNQMYTSLPAPAMYGLIINWLMKQPGRKGARLPDATFHMDEPVLKEVTVNGKTMQIKLVALYFDPYPTPQYIWLTKDMQFFASVSPWTNDIMAGYESWKDELIKTQEIASQPYFHKEVENKSRELVRHILFTHASIFQSYTASVQKDMNLEVTDGKITAIYPYSTSHTTLKADTIIDCKGKFIMPGLWDMHVHYSKDGGPRFLATGVTHIRDMGNDKILLTYRKQIRENNLMGPDLSYLSGFIDKVDPFQGPTGIMINSLEEGIKAINEYHELGYPQIKLYSAILPGWVAPLAAHAHKLGMRVCGHIPSHMTAEQAIKAGYDEITHLNFLFLNFRGDTVDTRTPARFRLVGEYGGSLDLQSKKVQDFISLLKQRNIVIDATMIVWEEMFNEFKGDTSHYIKPIISWLPESALGNLANQTPYGSEEQKPAYKAAFSNMMKMMKLLYDKGIFLVAGTDDAPGFPLQHELEIYTEAGIPANQVLKIATYNAAKDCNLENKYGQVLTGREADFILIDGDPSVHISDIRRVEWVIKNQRMYQPKQILQAEGWKYYY